MALNNVVKNDTRGHGYSYASLGDIAKQGFTIPKMKTGTENMREYVYWYDSELKEWFRGSEIILIQSKMMNQAQVYGAALTYARRYTALMALNLVCDDDVQLENTTGAGEAKPPISKPVDTGEPITPAQLEVIEKLGIAQIQNILRHFQVERTKDLTKAQAAETISKLRGK